MRRLLAVAAGCALVGASTITTESMSPEAQSDLITSLPGLGPRFAAKRRMFSGYIPVDGTDRELFYWFVESDHGMGNRPVLLWTNGGPGCSGFLGLLTEQGPFRPSAHGWLLPNDFAWTRYASVVFIEQPVGVGFSRSGKMAETYSDGNAASDNYRFVVNFFERFRELKKNEFYITSESYGGHYMPMLAKQIVDRGGVPQFRGFMVGNPLTSGPLRDFGEFATFAGHQLLPKSLTTQYFKDHSCRDEPGSFACTRLMMEARSIVAGLDPYGLDFPKCNAHVMAEKVAFLKVLGLIDASVQPRAVKDSGDGDQAVARRSMQYFPNKYLPCEEGYATKWLNRKDVQAALHVRPGKAPWAGCNDFINMAWNRTDTVVSMVPYYHYLAAVKPALKIWVYSGDDDSVCATAGDQEWIWDFGAVGKAWVPWHVDGQVAGWVTHLKGLVYSTVHGAGHMVPSTRPRFALELLKRFLEAA